MRYLSSAAHFTVAVAVGAAVLATALEGNAQSSNQAAAEGLFREGRRLLDAKRYPEACQKLSASQKLDPALGTLMNLALCYEKAGQTASAWSMYHDAITLARAAGQHPREQVAAAAAAALEPLLARLSVTVSTPAKASNPSVTRDGVAIPPEAWGAPLPVDPGEHTIEAKAAGSKTWSTMVKVEPKTSSIVTVPALESNGPDLVRATSPGSSPATVTTSSLPKVDTTLPGDSATTNSSWSVSKTAAVALGVVGAAGLAAGVMEGLTFTRKKNESQDICDGHCGEPNHSQAIGLRDDASRAATVGIVASALGGACVVAGVVLWLTADHNATRVGSVLVTPAAGYGSAGVSVHAAF